MTQPDGRRDGARASGRRERIRTRFGAGVLILAALAVGTVIQSGTPDTDTTERPFSRAGAVGKPVDAKTFDATVLSVRGGTKIKRDGGLSSRRREHETGGVWVLVRVRLVAREEAILVGWAAVVDGRGRTYHLTNRIDQPLVGSGRMLQPGIPVTGEVAFEVPRDAATNLTIQITDRALDVRMSAMVEVPLPAGKATVDGWLANTTTMILTTPEVS
jgi:hypothetical protein